MARLCEQSSNDSFKDRASIPKEMARPCEQSSNDFFKREGNHSQRNGAPGRIRTCDTWLRKPVLYPLSYERFTGCLNH